jgi:hypothetical protein
LLPRAAHGVHQYHVWPGLEGERQVRHWGIRVVIEWFSQRLSRKKWTELRHWTTEEKVTLVFLIEHNENNIVTCII